MGGTHLLVLAIGLFIGISIGALATRHPFRKGHFDQFDLDDTGSLVDDNDSKKAKRFGSPN
jgi:uncharacterized membrane-anchored protein YhcB (DUF1043 family)